MPIVVFCHFRMHPLASNASERGPGLGRCTDVSAVMDLMTHDLDLIHRLVPGEIDDVRASGRVVAGPFTDEMTANISFEDGCEVNSSPAEFPRPASAPCGLFMGTA